MSSLTSIQKQTSRRINGLGTLLVILLAVLIIITLLIRRKHIPYNQRQINKRYLNPLMLKVAGRRFSPQAIVLHTGRRSGRSYRTPVLLEPVADGFIIPLPYGMDVDWCRNILAAGQCSIEWHGNMYTVIKPEVKDTEVAITPLPHLRQSIFRMIGVKQVLKVRISTITLGRVPIDH